MTSPETLTAVSILADAAAQLAVAADALSRIGNPGDADALSTVARKLGERIKKEVEVA